MQLAALIGLGLSVLCVAAAIYYLRVAASLVVKLATDCTHMKILIGLLVEHMASKGYVVLDEDQPKASASQRAKMN